MSDKNIKTPMQQLLKLIYSIGANEEYILKEDIVSWLSCFGMNEEKEFARMCFDSGRGSIIRKLNTFTIKVGEDMSKDFDNFYKQYEQ